METKWDGLIFVHVRMLNEDKEHIYIKYDYDDDFIQVPIIQRKSTRSKAQNNINPMDAHVSFAYHRQRPIISQKVFLTSLVHSGAIPALYKDVYFSLPCEEKEEYIDDIEYDCNSD